MPEANTLYEAMYIINPGLTPEEVDQVVGRIENHITANGGELVGTRDFGRRHLAYKIAHQSEGIYKIAYFRGGGAVVDEVKREFLLTETIVRSTVFLANPDCYLDEHDDLIMPTTGTRRGGLTAEEAAPESAAPAEEPAEAAPVEESAAPESAAPESPIAEPVAEGPAEAPAAEEPAAPEADTPESAVPESAEVAEVPAEPGEEPKTEDEPGPAAA